MEEGRKEGGRKEENKEGREGKQAGRKEGRKERRRGRGGKRGWRGSNGCGDERKHGNEGESSGYMAWQIVIVNGGEVRFTHIRVHKYARVYTRRCITHTHTYIHLYM